VSLRIRVEIRTDKDKRKDRRSDKVCCQPEVYPESPPESTEFLIHLFFPNGARGSEKQKTPELIQFRRL
jgi:hypothetical protein